MSDPSLQERYAPTSICFGCGPANDKGLRIRSVPGDDEVTCEWLSAPHHRAFPGMLSGGIIGTLLDCHSNWTAAWFLMQQAGKDHPDCTVTAEFTVKLRRPTPSDQPLLLRAKVRESKGDRAWVEATLESGGKVCATCTGLFVQVKEGHLAYHRW